MSDAEDVDAVDGTDPIAPDDDARFHDCLCVSHNPPLPVPCSAGKEATRPSPGTAPRWKVVALPLQSMEL